MGGTNESASSGMSGFQTSVVRWEIHLNNRQLFLFNRTFTVKKATKKSPGGGGSCCFSSLQPASAHSAASISEFLF